MPNAQGEYDIIQHLSKTPAKISVKELIERSPSHWQALFKFLQEISVNTDLPPENLTQAILSLSMTKNKTPPVVFSDEEWAPEECRSLPLCISIALNGIMVDSVLIDTGASINVCPVSTFESLGVDEKDLQKVTTTVTAYDNTKRGARGGVKLQLKLGPVVMMTSFVIMDIVPTFKIILGRPWVRQTMGVPSTIHQCYKFPHNGKILKVKSIPQIEVIEMFSAEGMASTSEPKGKEPMVNILEVGPSPVAPVPQSDPVLRKNGRRVGSDRAWKMMLKMGFCQGQGLGKDNQGLTYLPLQEVSWGEGLGYYCARKHNRPLRWTLQNHFVRPSAGGQIHISELEAYPSNTKSIAREEQRKQEEEEVYDLTKLFSEAGLEPEPESDISDFLEELLGYLTIPPSDRAESFRAFTQLAAWDSLDSHISGDTSSESPIVEGQPLNPLTPSNELLFSPSDTEYCLALTHDD